MEHLRPCGRRWAALARLAEYQLGVLDSTPPLRAATRGAEIEAWLAHHPAVAGFVILEDSDRHIASFTARPALAQRYIQTYLHEARSASRRRTWPEDPGRGLPGGRRRVRRHKRLNGAKVDNL